MTADKSSDAAANQQEQLPALNKLAGVRSTH